jgi:O-antigen ligase
VNIITTSLTEDRLLFIALVALIVWIPLPHGGELLWEHSSLCAASLLLLATWIVHHMKSQAALPKIIHSLRRPLLLLLCWVIYVFMQAMPIPQLLLKWLSPAAIKHAEAIQSIGGNVYYSLSIDRGSTLIEGLKYCSYTAVFFLTLVLCSSIKRLTILATALFLTGAGLSLYSLVNHYTDGAFSINNPIPPWGNPWAKNTRGTFSHQNHFAAFLAMTIPLGLGLLYSLISPDNRQNKLNNRLVAAINFVLSIKALYVLLLACMIAALLLTASRGGNSAFLAGILVCSMLYLLKKWRVIDLTKTPIVSAILLCSVIAVESSGLATSLTKRLRDQGLAPSGRDFMHITTTKIILDYPIFGGGAGSYPYLQHAYKPEELGVNPMSKRAHNDYLELLCGQGIVGFVLLGAALWPLLYRVFKTLGNTQDGLITGLLLGASAGQCAMLIHAFVEFNFHIPANTIYFFLLLAIGLIAGYQENTKTAHSDNLTTPESAPGTMS